MPFLMRCFVSAIVGVLVAQAAGAGEPPPFPVDATAVEKTRDAIERGVKALVGLQREDGRWQHETTQDDHPLGTTTLALAALRKSAVPNTNVDVVEGDAAVAKMIDEFFVMGRLKVGSVACYILDLIARGDPQENMLLSDIGIEPSRRPKLSAGLRRELARCVEFLLENQQDPGGWWYQPARRRNAKDPTADESGITLRSADIFNTHLVLIALRAARNRGIKVNQKAIARAAEFLVGRVDADAARAEEVEVAAWGNDPKSGTRVRRFSFRASPRPFVYGTNAPSAPATAAGTHALSICLDLMGRRSGDRRAALRAYREGLAWLVSRKGGLFGYHVTEKHSVYCLFALERFCMERGIRWLGDSDWYADLLPVLLARESRRAPGVWSEGGGGYAKNIDTALVLLMFKRATFARGTATPKADATEAAPEGSDSDEEPERRPVPKPDDRDDG